MGYSLSWRFQFWLRSILPRAQKAMKVFRIGFAVSGRGPAPMPPAIEAFRKSLRELGYVEDKTFYSSTDRPKAKSIVTLLWQPNSLVWV